MRNKALQAAGESRDPKQLTLIVKSWKTHPECFPKFQFSGRETDRIPGKTHPFFRMFNLWGMS